jgi:hypothetical protein
LTPYEIGELCKWEGTLWARQRYERDEGVKVLDTTGNEIKPWVRGKNASGHKRNSSGHIKARYDTNKPVYIGEERRIPLIPEYSYPQRRQDSPVPVPMMTSWSLGYPIARQMQFVQSPREERFNSSIQQTTTVFVSQQIPPTSMPQPTIQIEQPTRLPTPPGEIECGEESFQKDEEIRPFRETQSVQVFDMPTPIMSSPPSSPPSMDDGSSSAASP